jgi:glycosyltransferase involved in cell wall biosynthesis
MKVCIDAGIGLSSFEKGGIYYLLPEFLNSLSLIDKENEYLIFGYFWRNYKEKIKNIKIPDSPNFSLKTIRIPNKIVKIFDEKLKIPLIELLLKKEEISIYHSISGCYLPDFKKVKKIYTVYDLSFEINPEFYKDKWYIDIKKSILKGDLIITPSFSTKNDLIKIYKIPETKIKVIYLGVNKRIFKPVDRKIARERLKKYFDFERYILTVATSIMRKNIPFLIDVYKILKDKKIEEKLVIIVGTDFLKYEILKLIKEKNINDVFVFSEIPTEEMPYFYSGAELFVFLSLYEGFGLPVVEAMSCGCPVIVSNVSSLPEIVNNPEICVNPYNIAEASDRIYEILTDENSKLNLSKKSIERAKIFDWEKCARETMEVYKNLIEK